MLPQMRFFETWGRDIEMKFVTSSGNDEAAQRADVVAIKAMKPFAVVNLVNNPDLDILETALAAAKILATGYATTTEQAERQAPYRWGQNDKQATAINSAEVIGKQLVGKKAQFGGDDVKDLTRKFGVVSQERTIDYDGFLQTVPQVRRGSGDATRRCASNDPQVVQDAAPTIITRMKAAGVTTVITFADFTVLRILMENATKQEWHPEWFFTGAQVQDIGILVRGFPTDQSQHAFGISSLTPWLEPDPTPPPPQLSYTQQIDPLELVLGTGAGTVVAADHGIPRGMVAHRHPHRGAEPHPEDVRAGSVLQPTARRCARGTAPTSAWSAYGKGPKLPYNEYAGIGFDFAPYWWDTETTGPSNGLGTVGKGVGWYVDGGKRYVATTWPKQQFAWFDKASRSTTSRRAPVPPARIRR